MLREKATAPPEVSARPRDTGSKAQARIVVVYKKPISIKNTKPFADVCLMDQDSNAAFALRSWGARQQRRREPSKSHSNVAKVAS